MAVGTFGFDIEGLRELDNALKQLPKSLRKPTMVRAMRKSLEPTKALAVANCPYDPADNWHGKHLRDTLEISTRLNRSQRRQSGRLPDSVEVFMGSSSPLAHLVEFGTAERFRDSKAGTGSTGRMPANPFLTRAWDATKAGAFDILKTQLWQEIAKTAKRVAKKAAKGTLSVKVQREILDL